MAFIHCKFSSVKLQKATEVYVVLPEEPMLSKKKLPVVYLLHGLSDDASMWSRRSSIERYACERGFAVVMPDGGRSFYINPKEGAPYGDFIEEELPAFVRAAFPVSEKREENFIAGLSMGGYGALRCALAHPDRFAAAAGLSGVADISSFRSRQAALPEEAVWKEMHHLFGNSVADELNLFKLAEKVPVSRQPHIFMACGTEDFLYEDNRKLRQHFLKLGWRNYHYEEGPGAHTWAFWDAWIPKALDFFLETRTSPGQEDR